jgi:hypothetical protein
MYPIFRWVAISGSSIATSTCLALSAVAQSTPPPGVTIPPTASLNFRQLIARTPTSEFAFLLSLDLTGGCHTWGCIGFFLFLLSENSVAKLKQKCWTQHFCFKLFAHANPESRLLNRRSRLRHPLNFSWRKGKLAARKRFLLFSTLSAVLNPIICAPESI